MATQTGTTLKTYFNTGDKPTEGQFGDLIDSNLNLTDGGTVAGDSTFSGNTTFSAPITASSATNNTFGLTTFSGLQNDVITVNGTLQLQTSSSGCIIIASASAADVSTVVLPTCTDASGCTFKIIAGSVHSHVVSGSEATGAGKINGVVMDLNNTAGNTDGAGGQQLSDEHVLSFANNPKLGDQVTVVGNGAHWFISGFANDGVDSAT
jgi:hypothetical protein